MMMQMIMYTKVLSFAKLSFPCQIRAMDLENAHFCLSDCEKKKLRKFSVANEHAAVVIAFLKPDHYKIVATLCKKSKTYAIVSNQ